MSVFTSRETTYLENTAIFCNSVKSVRILMMLSITYVKIEISTKSTWALYFFMRLFANKHIFWEAEVPKNVIWGISKFVLIRPMLIATFSIDPMINHAH